MLRIFPIPAGTSVCFLFRATKISDFKRKILCTVHCCCYLVYDFWQKQILQYWLKMQYWLKTSIAPPSGVICFRQRQIQQYWLKTSIAPPSGVIDVEYIYGLVWWGVCKQSRWRHSVPSRQKIADMCYYGNVMITTRWWLCVTMETLWQQQDGGYASLWKRYDNNDVSVFRWR